MVGIIESRRTTQPIGEFIDDITDLAIGESTVYAVELTFTPPNSSSSISHYEVYVNGVFNEHITSTGDFTIYLDELTTYDVYIIAVDVNGLKSNPSNTATGSTNSTFISKQADEIFSFRRLIDSATNCVTLERLNDNVETTVLFDSNGLISMNSPVSSGGDLATWIGSNSAIVKAVFGQKGFKNLNYTNEDFKLIENGVLYKIGNLAAFKILSGNKTKLGLEGIGFNGGNNLTDGSFFIVYENEQSNNLDTQVAGFGNQNVDGLTGSKRHWKLAEDHSLRFDGGALTNNQVAPFLGQKIRSTTKSGNNFKDWINGQKNLDRVITGTSIKDDFYWPTASTLFGGQQKSSEVLIYISDKTRHQKVIEHEINREYQIF